MYYKFGQACVKNWGNFVLLQIRTDVATNCGSFIITNWDKCCYRLGQLLQIRATVITKQSSYFIFGQNFLQIGAGITNQGNYYKLGYNREQQKKVREGRLEENPEVYSVFTNSIDLSECQQILFNFLRNVDKNVKEIQEMQVKTQSSQI